MTAMNAERSMSMSLGALLGDVLAATAGAVRDLHETIAARSYKAVGALGRPAQLAHDTIAGGVYGLVGLGLEQLPRVGAVIVASTRGEGHDATPRLPRSPLLSAANGFYGDHFARAYPALAIPMAVRAGGIDVAPAPDAIAAAWPSATRKLVVFVHGLAEDDESWRRSSARVDDERDVTYASELQHEHGFTPLMVRYNSGLHVSDNAVALDALLDEFVGNWPVAVDRVVLVGHSMGGLVVRGAAHVAAERQAAWGELVDAVVCLGTPHLGAPLEKAVNAIAHATGAVPESRFVSRFLNLRSAGIKDLRYGAVVEADWAGHDPDEFLTDRCTEVPFLERVAYHFVGATVTRDALHPAGQLLGDLLVRLPSATGVDRRRHFRFPLGETLHVGGMNHLDLLNHPVIGHQLGAWLDRAARLPVGN